MSVALGILSFIFFIIIIGDEEASSNYKSDIDDFKSEIRNYKSRIRGFENKIKNYKSRNSNDESDIDKYMSKIKEYEDKIEEYEDYRPIIIEDIKFGIVEYNSDIIVPYGGQLISHKMRYLSPHFFQI